MKKMLLALVEEMGHEFEDLMEGATPLDTAEDNKPDETGLLVATKTITTNGDEERSEDEDGDE